MNARFFIGNDPDKIGAGRFVCYIERKSFCRLFIFPPDQFSIALTELQQQLPEKQFVRIHKSYVVNRKFVSEVRANTIKVLNTELPVGRTFQDTVNSFFGK